MRCATHRGGARFNPIALVFASRNETGLEQETARAALDRALKAVPSPDVSRAVV